MKKLFFLIMLLIAGLSSQAQFVNGVPLKKINAEYIQITIKTGSFQNSKNCEIDYGQEFKQKIIGYSKESLLRDKEGKAIDFNSNMAILNFMADKGYKLEEVLQNEEGLITSYVLISAGYLRLK